MQLNLIEDNSDFLVIGKPSGLTTHQSSPREWGFVEWITDFLQQPLFVVHRLDRDTSGVMVFAKSKSTASDLAAKWESREVKKTYLFVTDRTISGTEHVYKSYIEKQGKAFISSLSQAANSETQFKLLKKEGSLNLWQAQPLTGKPHQIRLHAQALGMPILGDELYAGSPFFRLCLHASELEFPWLDKTFKCEPPSFFKNLSECNDVLKCRFLEALGRRKLIYNYSEHECLRISHRETDPIRIDKFGSQYWIYNYGDKLEADEVESMPTPYFERQMLNRGDQPLESMLKKSAGTTDTWIATENEMQFEFRSNSGLSPGLFLDQRENRKWVKTHSNKLKVLNLFSYTGGFSVAAAIGGASRVCTVDVSRNFIDWSKKNFELNSLDVKAHEFWVMESQEFLKLAAKKNREFDLIICDPPSLARNKSGVFKIEKDLPALVTAIWQCLASQGTLLLSTNYEKWNDSDLLKIATSKIPQNTFHEVALPLPGLDYELNPKDRLLKAVALRKD